MAERRLLEALSLLRRLEKLLQRFVAAADASDPPQQVGLLGATGLLLFVLPLLHAGRHIYQPVAPSTAHLILCRHF